MVEKRETKRYRDPDRKPHFFKILLGDFAERLKLPPNFLKHVPNEASVTLQGPNGDSWSAELMTSNNGSFLSTGWSKFVKDHSLNENDFLVFRYDGNMHFSIQVFDTTACQREDLFTMKSQEKPKISGGSTNGKKRKTSVENKNGKNPEISGGLDAGCFTEYKETRTELPAERLTDEHHTPKRSQDHSSNSIKGSCGASLSPRRDIKIKSEAKHLPNCVVCPGTNRQCYLRQHPVTTEDRSQAYEAANSFSSVFPFVVLRLTSRRVHNTCTVRFPASFSQAHLPWKKTNMILRDPNEKAWVVVYIPGSHKYLSAGWPAFARGNNLQNGDSCVFELLSTIEMRVHIFKEVKETPS